MVIELISILIVLYILYGLTNYFFDKKTMVVKFDTVILNDNKDKKKLKKEFKLKILMKKKAVSFILNEKKILLYLNELYSTNELYFSAKDNSYTISFDKAMRQDNVYFVSLKDKAGSIFFGVGKIN